MHPSSQPDPQQGGYGYPQPPVSPGGPPAPMMPHDDTVPGQATTVRVLMFIGGPIGIVVGLVIGFIALLGFGTGQLVEGLNEGDVDSGAFSFLAGAVGLFALIPFVYGFASTLLAALMGRRKKGIYWGTVAFNIAAALFLVLFVISGDYLMLVPLAFHTTMAALMFVPRVRVFYGV